MVEVSTMLAAIDRVTMIEQAEHLAKMILQSDVAEAYRICLYKLQNNRESQQKINHFSQLKDLYEDAKRFGKYHPDYKRIMIQTREAKRDMDLDPCVAEFKIAENDLQDLLDEISVYLGRAVSENIKAAVGNPFFETAANCGTGCASGGSCGCSA
jgi:cell fate (sporulation/competence/biofilm development) regulator YlbF (YheA/YmcA/DUF963 family)